jgi:hypothetical protein
MFTSEFFAELLKELPGVLDIIVRYWHELFTHGIGILSNML